MIRCGLWKVSDGTYGALLKVALLTTQRIGKVKTMKWSDLKDGEWTIATDKREKGNAGIIKLPEMVTDIINQQPHLAGNPYVFAGRGNGPFNALSQRKRELDKKLPDMRPWVVHDLRRTARSVLSKAEAGVPPHIAERVLGHIIRGVEGIYDRHSYGPEKAHALRQLAAIVEKIFNPPPPNGVAIDRKKKRRA